ncbi:MAG: hypothetical protein HQK77_05705 [Desulfobacterales bacterium]|nr:hypothetical protein [Desulfobacterales bacterium]
MTTHTELMTARIILRAMLPVTKVVVTEDADMKMAFRNVTASIQFVADHDGEKLGAYLMFQNGCLEVHQGVCDHSTICFRFSSVAAMNALFKGKFAIPKISGWRHPMVLLNVFRLLFSLKILMPNVRPKDIRKQALKVKMAFYMITTALSQYNKGGNPDMVKWTSKQPERIYQITVDPDNISAYLRIKAGKSKAGRGVYLKRKPFVHLKFHGVQGAFPIVMNDVDMVEAMKRGYLEIEGSPEYGRDFGIFMVRIQELLTQ